MKAKSNKQLSVENKLQKFVIGVLTTVFVIGALLVGGRLVLAATDTKVERKISEAVVLYALQNPESELSLVLAKYILVSEQGVLGNLEKERENILGVVTDDQSAVITERTCYKYSGSAFRYNCVGWGRLVLPTATTTVSEVSRLTADAVIDYAEATITGTNSSTWFLYVGTATSTFVDYDSGANGLNPRPDNLIDGFNFVTSTVTVEHPDRLDTYRNTINSINDSGTLGLNAVPFTTGTAIVAFMQNQVRATNGLCPGQACEAVTSSVANRGFSGEVLYRYHYSIDL